MSYHRESTHLHPDVRSALVEFGQRNPSPKRSGIGKDPRKSYEDAYWTDDEKAGHHASAHSMHDDLLEREETNQDAGEVVKIASLSANKRRMEDSNPLNSASAERRRGSISKHIKALQKDVEGVEKAKLDEKKESLQQDEGFQVTSESLSQHRPLRQLERDSQLSSQSYSEVLSKNEKDLKSMKADGDSDIVSPGPQLTKNRARRSVRNRL